MTQLETDERRARLLRIDEGLTTLPVRIAAVIVATEWRYAVESDAGACAT